MISNQEERIENRKRCLKCPYYGWNECNYLKADVFRIDKCILDNKEVIDLKENSPELFMFNSNPFTFFRYLNFKRKDILPEDGTKVVTLVQGYGGTFGLTRYVLTKDEKYIYLVNEENMEYFLETNDLESFLNGNKSAYICYIENWYNDIFEI